MITTSLSPVYPSGFSTRTPLADAEVVDKMRNPHFRVGWQEGELVGALNDLRAALGGIRRNHHTRATLERRIESIERTLRLGNEANLPAADTSEKVPVKLDASVTA